MFKKLSNLLILFAILFLYQVRKDIDVIYHLSQLQMTVGISLGTSQNQDQVPKHQRTSLNDGWHFTWKFLFNFTESRHNDSVKKSRRDVPTYVF